MVPDAASGCSQRSHSLSFTRRPLVSAKNAMARARRRPEVLDDALKAEVERPWRTGSRYTRRARVIETTPVTSTGTVLLTLQVIDDQPFAYKPGQFVAIEAEVAGVGRRHSPYCLLSATSDQPVFQLLIRKVTDGSLSLHLASLALGEVIAFRGPTGRSMLPKDPERELVMVATGVGIAPNYALARHVLEAGFQPRVRIFWGLRLVEDICLIDELDALAARYSNFSYYISLSRPPENWDGLRGRITHSMPPMLDVLGGTRFHLFGNGAMIAELAVALSDLGVLDEHTYKEAYFNTGRQQPDPVVVDSIRAQFTASDLFSPYAQQQRQVFHLERPLDRREPPPD